MFAEAGGDAPVAAAAQRPVLSVEQTLELLHAAREASEVLAPFSRAQLAELARAVRIAPIAVGEPLTRAGEEAAWSAVVLRGALEARDARGALLGVCRAGALCDELALVAGGKRGASLVGSEDGWARGIARASVHPRMKRAPTPTVRQHRRASRVRAPPPTQRVRARAFTAGAHGPSAPRPLPPLRPPPCGATAQFRRVLLRADARAPL